MPNPTATIFVPYHALNEAIDDPTIARTNEHNVFTEDQTIDGDLFVTGEVNPMRRLEQLPKINTLIGDPTGARTLMSTSLVSGLSLRHDDSLNIGRVACGNYDTQTYQPLLFEVESFQVHTGVSPSARVERLRVHPAGGVSVGGAAAHVTAPGIGVVRLSNVQFPAAPVLSADPTTLDCYAEGAWTPVIGGAGGQSGQGYSVQTGLFTRLGRLLFATFIVTFSNKGTITGDLRLFGLPYPLTTLPGAGGGGFLTFSNLNVNWVTITVRAIAGTTTASLGGTTKPDKSNDLPLAGNDLTNITDLRGMLIFHV